VTSQQDGSDESQLETGVSPETLLPEALDRWGPFENLLRVGRGSFGEVYRAFDPTLQRHVALKLLLHRGLDRDAEASALLKEARAMARVRHPNVVSIYGVDQHQGRAGFWSDFVEGQTLSHILATQGSMGAREAALVGIDVCRAAGAVHAAGFVHRDIKTGNVMREKGGRILLMDFGLTYESGSDSNPSGTPTYMAPELLAGEASTVASDVYAIGVLIFNLLTGRYPVEGTDVEQLRTEHGKGARRTLLDVRPDLPQALAQVVETAIQADPQKRFGSAGQLVAALSEAIGMGSQAQAAPPPAKPRTLRPWMLAAAGVAAAGLLLAWPQLRALVGPRPIALAPSQGAQDDYRRARELLTHYYRPQALETAIPLLEGVVAQDPQFAPAFADLARANFLQFTQQRDTKYLEPARLAARQAIALRPDLASPHVTLGALYGWTGQNDLATHELEEALRLDRFGAAAYGALADVYKRQGRAELVEPTLQKAVSLAPDDWSLMQQLGEFYLDKGQWQQAGEEYRRAAELMPDNPRPHNNLGLVYQGLGRLEESAAAFQRAIDLEPSFIRFRNLGMVLAEAGKYEEAARMLERSIEMRPDNYRAWGLLAAVYENQHEAPAKVRDTFQRAIALAAELRKETPRDEYLLADIGGYYAALGLKEESLPLLAQAAALAPDIPQVLFQVAVGYEVLGRREDALLWLARAAVTGYPSASIARNPQLEALRADPRYAATVGGAR
jgi:Tfp pilus assembly protein PilF/tRNA A-37 threonylcarbamoyl transferase component Bud32